MGRRPGAPPTGGRPLPGTTFPGYNLIARPYLKRPSELSWPDDGCCGCEGFGVKAMGDGVVGRVEVWRGWWRWILLILLGNSGWNRWVVSAESGRWRRERSGLVLQVAPLKEDFSTNCSKVVFLKKTSLEVQCVDGHWNSRI